ncbi:MAG: tetratricopeptide repeat protein [Elusimicrobia bacterium]|nr:tetratricopeptide repeat protein [Elusimicrobiota bacterium]
MNKHTKHALLLLEQENYPLAEKEARTGAAESPRNPMCRAVYGHALGYMEKYKEAEEEAMAAIRLGPGTGYGEAVLSGVFARQNRMDEAQSTIEKANRLKPGNAGVLSAMAGVHAAKEDWETTLKNAEKALRKGTGGKEAWHFQALALRKLGRLKEATQAVISLLARDPNDAYALANYGWLHLENGDYEKALGCFHEALRLEPELDIAQEGLAALLNRSFWGRLAVRCLSLTRKSRTVSRLLCRLASSRFIRNISGGVTPASG